MRVYLLVPCGYPAHIANGRRSYSGTTEGKTATYACNPGYRLSGVSRRVCQSNGLWSGSQPSCESKLNYTHTYTQTYILTHTHEYTHKYTHIYACTHVWVHMYSIMEDMSGCLLMAKFEQGLGPAWYGAGQFCGGLNWLQSQNMSNTTDFGRWKGYFCTNLVNRLHPANSGLRFFSQGILWPCPFLKLAIVLYLCVYILHKILLIFQHQLIVYSFSSVETIHGWHDRYTLTATISVIRRTCLDLAIMLSANLKCVLNQCTAYFRFRVLAPHKCF